MQVMITMIRKSLSGLLLAGVLGASAHAQEGGETEVMQRALAAGYKAAFTCSATFNARQSRAVIEANELSGIYPDYRERFARLPDAEISDEKNLVSVKYADDMPPRIAIWRKGFGCTQLPPGASETAIEWVHHFDDWPDAGQQDRATAIGDTVTLNLPVYVQDRLSVPVGFAFDGETYGKDTRTSAVVIALRGAIVGERYGRGITAETPQRTWSAAKSITATVLGAAARGGLIGPDSKALLASWRSGGDPRREITLANLLHMASGLDSGEAGSRTDQIYFGGARVIDKAMTGTLEAVPGTRFKYANNDTLAAMRALREAIGDDAVYHNFPYLQVLWKIGARRTILEADWNGDFISSSQVWTTARDLARIGQLYLQEGVWAGEQILAPGWSDFVASPAPVQPESDFGYGAQFWLLNTSPGVPKDSFAAMGHRGQYLVIIPSMDLVIVRRGYDISGGTSFDIAAFTRDIVAAVRKGQEDRQRAEEAEQAAGEAEAGRESVRSRMRSGQR